MSSRPNYGRFAGSSTATKKISKNLPGKDSRDDPIVVKAPSAVLDTSETNDKSKKSQPEVQNLARTSKISKDHQKSTLGAVNSSNFRRTTVGKDQQVPDRTSKQVTKPLNPNKITQPVNTMSSRRPKVMQHDDKPVGGSPNISAVFGGKIEDATELSAVLVKQARQSGQLNLSNRNLSSIPDRVWKINDPDEDEQKSRKKGLSLDRVRKQMSSALRAISVIFLQYYNCSP